MDEKTLDTLRETLIELESAQEVLEWANDKDNIINISVTNTHDGCTSFDCSDDAAKKIFIPAIKEHIDSLTSKVIEICPELAKVVGVRGGQSDG